MLTDREVFRLLDELEKEFEKERRLRYAPIYVNSCFDHDEKKWFICVTATGVSPDDIDARRIVYKVVWRLFGRDQSVEVYTEW